MQAPKVRRPHDPRNYNPHLKFFSIPYRTVLKLTLTYDNTVVALVSNQQELHFIVHFSSEGELLNSTKVNSYFFTFAMLRNDVVILYSNHGAISSFSLKDKILNVLRDCSMMTGNDKSKKLYFFPETNLFCVMHQKQPPNHSINSGHATVFFEYYSYIDAKNDSEFKTCHLHESPGYIYYSHKMNNHSKITWLEVTAKGTLMNILELDEEFQIKVKSVNIGKMGNLFESGLERTWKPIYELEKKTYISAIVSDRTDEGNIMKKCVKYSIFSINQEERLTILENGTQLLSDYRMGPKMYDNIFKKEHYVIIVSEKADNGNDVQTCRILKISCKTGQISGSELIKCKELSTYQYLDVEWSDKLIIEVVSDVNKQIKQENAIRLRVIDVSNELNWI